MSMGLEHVSVHRHGRVDLDDTSVELAAGSLTAVVGGDGAGKTTLLQVLAGAVVPTTGTVRTPGRARIGYVSAWPGIYGDLTTRENLRFAGTTYGLTGDALEARVEALLDTTDLAGAAHRLASRLSGGMRQKLAFACAVLHRPYLLVLDEPTTGVDPISRAELWRLVSAALADGAAAIFATTYVDEAARADHVIVLDHGRTIAEGTPASIRASTPGLVIRVEEAPPGLPSWRRGRIRHAWVASGSAPDGAPLVEPDIEDAVIVAALAADREIAA